MTLVTTQGCARCHGDGHKLKFQALTHPITHRGEVVATHWAICPETGEPIVMRLRSMPTHDIEEAAA